MSNSLSQLLVLGQCAKVHKVHTLRVFWHNRVPARRGVSREAQNPKVACLFLVAPSLPKYLRGLHLMLMRAMRKDGDYYHPIGRLPPYKVPAIVE